MKERYQSKIAVFLILIRESDKGKEILLQERCNTGYMDGLYDMACSGHVEKGESLTQAVVREAKEEIGIDVNVEDVELSLLLHPYYDDYLNIFFKANNYVGTPKIMEPEKCSDLNWFNINKLPSNTMPRIRNVIECINNGIKYDDGYFSVLESKGVAVWK